MADYYRALKIMPSATPEQVASAYQRELARLGPGAADPGATVAIGARLALEKAYATLSDPQRRAEYNASLQAGAATVAAPTPDPAAAATTMPPPDPATPVAATPPPGPHATQALAVPAAPSAQAPVLAATLPMTPPPPRFAPPSIPSLQGTNVATPIAFRACPNCGAANPVQATSCAACRTQLSRPCPRCGLPLVLGAIVCERCGASVPEYDTSRLMEARTVEQRVLVERQEAQASVMALEAANSVRYWQSVFFWAVVAALVVVAIVVAAIISARSGG